MGIEDLSIKVKSLHCWRPFTDRETPRSRLFAKSYMLLEVTAVPKNEGVLIKMILLDIIYNVKGVV